MTDPKQLENWLHEKAGPAYDALKADLTRAVTPDQVRHTLAELLTEAEAAGVYPLPREEREWVDAPAVGRELTPFDPSEELTTTEAISDIHSAWIVPRRMRSGRRAPRFCAVYIDTARPSDCRNATPRLSTLAAAV